MTIADDDADDDDDDEEEEEEEDFENDKVKQDIKEGDVTLVECGPH